MSFKRLFAASVTAVFCLFLQETVPARDLPEYPLTTVSPEFAQFVTPTPLSPIWREKPETPEAWRALREKCAEAAKPLNRALAQKLSVTVTPGILAGVPVFTLMPKEEAPEHRGRVLLYIHGGGYVLNPGEAGLDEGLSVAGHGKIRVVSVDYRMAPEHPYPAALDDVVAVYRALLRDYAAGSIGVFGSSTGGGLTLALALRLRDEGVPLPAALAPGSPWSDLGKVGDTYFSNEGQDNILVTYDNWLRKAAEAYAGGESLRNPYLSPVYGDFTGFPPVFLTSGTRDLFLSNTVRVHEKLRRAGVPADLYVFEGMSHVQFYLHPDVAECKTYCRELTCFFDRYFK